MKISIALCTFNGEKFLKQQLDSILNQKGNFDIEIIVCDDKSTDKTLDILYDYKHKFQDIFKIFYNEKNLGTTKNFEKAISLCNGDYIFLADQDDIWSDIKIIKILESFKQNEKLEGVFSDAYLINNKGQRFTTFTLWQSIFFKENQLKKPIDYYDLMTKNGNIVTGSTFCVKNEIKQYILPIPDKFNHDEWIATILSLRQTLSHNSNQLIAYRIHKDQQVGVKLLKKIKKIDSRKNIILGIQNPVLFKDYRVLQKKQFLKIKKTKHIDDFNFSYIKINSLLIECQKDYVILNEKIEKKFPFRFKIFSFIDKILGKRQI